MERLINNPKLLKQAEDKVKLIYRNLKRNHSKIKDMSLYSGKMGLCLFFYYYELLVINKKGVAQKTLFEINDIISENENRLSHVLWFSEFGWLLQHLNDNHFINIDVNEILSETDEVLQYTMVMYIKEDKYELLYGAVNIANYFLHRDFKHKEKCFDLFIETLYEKSTHLDESRITWLSYADVSSMRKNDDKHINLGIAHGIPALILFFCKLKRSNYNHRYLDELLFKTCNYLLSLEQDTNIYISHFNSFLELTKKKDFGTSRIAWCYGDLSIGFALLNAAQFYPEIEEKSINLLIDTTKRKETAYVFDDSFCHGSIGVAHMYSRIYSITQREYFLDSARYWYEKGITNKYRHNCAAGIGFYTGNNNNYCSNHCLLDGIAGIGLSLISAIYDITPNWDECFLLS